MKKFVLCLVLASMTLVLRSGYAQDKSLKKIRWGVTSLSASQWIPWIAKEAKIYEKHGLDTELILLRGSGQSSQAIIGGSIFAAPVTLPWPIPFPAFRASCWLSQRLRGRKIFEGRS